MCDVQGTGERTQGIAAIALLTSLAWALISAFRCPYDCNAPTWLDSGNKLTHHHIHFCKGSCILDFEALQIRLYLVQCTEVVDTYISR
jgi:hypothetical protein